MIDTLKIQSSSIPENVAREIERSIVRRSGVDMSTGQVLYELYSGQVRDEREHGINVRVMRNRLVPVVELAKTHEPTKHSYHSHPILVEKKRPTTVACAPYLWLEGSVHKAMLGHNVWGGPRELLPSVSWLVSDVSRRLGLELPSYDDWDVMRADWAETYDLGSFENCQDYVRSLNSARFPRREPQRYGDNSLSFPGRSTALRIYHKLPEFLSSDSKRLGRQLTPEALSELVTRADSTLRVEVSVKRPKIIEYHPLTTKATGIQTTFLQEVHDHEVKKVIREANSDLTIVRDSQSVLKRLSAVYAGRDRLIRSLFSTWVQLSGLGENTVKVNMKEWSFYDHRKKLLDAGCAWRGSDVRMGEEVREIMSFMPVATDPRCTSEEHPEVTRLLEVHRHIA
ncbi:phage/plasmid replication domain-containing protein [Rubrobacter indicoceani]|uniref:phage/plasmid replication domain-containing protein n=1 Tax=Rubrobacter indicoceani TaxID=2051957 RepID=UPI000E5A7B9D|nr:phage/plasmid replication protein [Rubrobacter indicoceani]